MQEPEQLGLEVERQLADLVEEDRAVVGELEAADALRGRSGEGALLVPHELALEQGARDGGAVDLDEAAVLCAG